jgi:hypothetical protein
LTIIRQAATPQEAQRRDLPKVLAGIAGLM